jgi:hypothetical protein
MDMDMDNMMDVDEKVDRIVPQDFSTNSHNLLKASDIIDESVSNTNNAYHKNELPPS